MSTDPGEPTAPEDPQMERLTRQLIIWTCSMIFLAGVLGFIAGRFA